jgi:hypothetical protein
MPRSKGIIGIIMLVLLLGFVVAGYFYIRANPNTIPQLKQELLNDTQSTDSTSFVGPLALAREQERREGVKSLSEQIFQYTSEHTGILPANFPTTETCIGAGEGCYNLGSILVPRYLSTIPKDPKTGTDANTGYTTYKNADGRIVVRIKGELGGEFEIVR